MPRSLNPKLKKWSSPRLASLSNGASRHRSHSKGVILPVTLVLLVVLITAGAVASRNAAVSEQVSNNFRTSNVAYQAAEIGIRYCESVAIDSIDNLGTSLPSDRAKIPATTITLTGPADSTAKWNTLANWKVTTVAITVPASQYKPTNTSVDSGIQLVNAPTCIIERLKSTQSDRFLITARGLSNDAKTNATGQLTHGSESWLQSTLRRPV